MMGQMSTILMGFADTLMVGRYGTSELAAAGFVNNAFGLLIIGGMGFSYGLTPIVGALMGEGREHAVAGKLKNGLLACLMVGLLLMLLAGVLLAALPWLGLPGELLPLMRPYLFVLLLSLLPQMVFNAYKQFSDAIQDTTTPMWIMLASNVFNVVGNALLIFGLCGFPEMGLLGAGLATLLSRVVQLALMMGVFHLTRHYELYRRDFPASSVSRADQRELHRLGWPVAFQLGMEAASFSFSAIYVGWLGAKALAAHQVMIIISQFFFMLYYGMSAAVAVKVSFYRGEGLLGQTRQVAFAGLHLCWLIAFGLGIPLFLLRGVAGMLFTGDAEVVSLVAAITIPFLIFQFGDSLQSTYANALRGMARVKAMAWIAFFAYVVVSLPLGYIFGFVCRWGLVGIWMAFPFGLTTAGLLYFREFRRSTKRASAPNCPIVRKTL
ncbi:MAG: MATE family efflux transporter [Bacteroidaceae bacterium]|nr:MATE family efflux transporter [Bacteroidaceae bacterium]